MVKPTSCSVVDIHSPWNKGKLYRRILLYVGEAGVDDIMWKPHREHQQLRWRSLGLKVKTDTVARVYSLMGEK